MNFIALKMLIGDRGKYFGIVMGLTFASLLITQQAGIFFGMMGRTFGSITDMGLPDIWIMDSKVQGIDDIKPLQDTVLFRIRGVEGVQWAVPHFRGLLEARLDNGAFQACNVLGLDDATLVGGPPEMVAGKLEDLRRADSVVVDVDGAAAKLAHVNVRGETVPLRIGDTLELNDHRAMVVGFCRVSKTLQSEPVVYTTYSRATLFAPRERKLLSFVLAKARPGVDPSEVCRRIERATVGAMDSRGWRPIHAKDSSKRRGGTSSRTPPFRSTSRFRSPLVSWWEPRSSDRPSTASPWKISSSSPPSRQWEPPTSRSCE